MKITIFHPRGGVGRTTFTLLLARTLLKAGCRVTIDDLDPQQCAAYFARRDGIPVRDPHATMTITDTSCWAAHEPSRLAFRDADLAILPTTPSIEDLNTTEEVLRSLSSLRPHGDTRILLTMVRSTPPVARSIAAFRSRFSDLVFQNWLGYRAVYQLARSDPAHHRDSHAEFSQVALEILGDRLT